MFEEKYISYCGITQEYGIHETAEEAKQELVENYKTPDYAADREDYTDGFIAEIKWRATLKTHENENQGTIVEPQFAGLDEFLKREKAKKAFSKICDLVESFSKNEEDWILFNHYCEKTINRLKKWLLDMEEKSEKEKK